MVERLGPYELERVVGRGGRGEVWLAWTADDPTTPVAVKRCRSTDAPDGLFGETALLRRIDHPSLVPLIDVVPDPPGVALVMPYLGGGSLRSLLDERGTLSAGEVVAILEPIASALIALAEGGVVHGDLKPENVLLADSGAPVLVDVGAARTVGRDGGPIRSGTAPYLDPASLHGAPGSARSDVFSLGVMAYESLTGRLPHRGDPAEIVALAAVGSHRPLRSWPAVSPDVATVVEAALDPDPSRRPSDATTFVACLAATVAPGDVALPGPVRGQGARAAERVRHRTVDFPLGIETATVERARRPSWRAVAAVGLAVGLALVAAGARTVGHRSPAVPAPPCPATVPGPGPGRLAWADLDGDGCDDPVRWDGRTLVTGAGRGARSFRIGLPGDQLLLGDWDDDGRATPALYRPSTGQVHYLDRLPSRVGEQVAGYESRDAPRNGIARVVDGSPDQVRVVGR